MYLIIWILFGIGAAIAGSNKGRSGFKWFLVGVLLGPFGLLFALLVPKVDTSMPTTFGGKYPTNNAASNSFNLPPGDSITVMDLTAINTPEGEISLDQETKKCPQCAEIIKLEAKKCRYCGEILDPNEVENIVRAHLAPLEEERARLALEMTRRAEGQAYCPGCDRWDKYPHAALGDGSIGPWCPHCQQPAKDSNRRCPRCEQWDILTTIALPDGRYILWCPHCQKPLPSFRASTTV
jgi:hypothetical protein